ncbi:MAG: gliding motility-associated C-terminal domain-containing protein [Microscillaceae bacterium]|nr:gliding motility-associated C-terminal domain-containing protein [Microscillaceae bacterium]
MFLKIGNKSRYRLQINRQYTQMLLLLCLSFGSKIYAQAPNQPPVLMDVFLQGQSSEPGNLFLYKSSPTTSIPVFVAIRNNFSLGLEPLRTAYPGTPTTTLLIRDISNGNSSFPREFTNYQNKFYFFANDGVSTTGTLWVSNVTLAGTQVVLNIFPGGDSQARFLTVSNNLLFFAARNSTDGSELWRSDGTAAGTVKDANINTNGSLGSFPESLTNVNIGGSDYLFFTADNSASPGAGSAGLDRELWVRSPLGVVSLVRNLKTVDGSDPKYLRAFNNSCVFFALDESKPGAPYGLWASNGTSAGTNSINLGTAALVDTIPPVISGNKLYFVATDATFGAELWAYDGITASRVDDIYPGANSSKPHNLADINGTLFFAADSSGVGVELFKSDGTAAGTHLVANIVSGSSFPNYITNVGGIVYFYVRNINPSPLYANNGYIYFHNPSTNVTGLYYSFASAKVAGQTNPIAGVGGALSGSYGEILPLPNGGFYFIADGINGRAKEPWYSAPCPTITLEYDPVNGNIVCSGNTAVSPVIRVSGATPAPSFDICPNLDNNCFTSSNPANLVIDPATGVINPSASVEGSYVITYDYDDGSCSTVSTVSITIQATVTADLLVEPVAGRQGVTGRTNADLLNSTFDFGALNTPQGSPLNDGSNNLTFSPDGTKIYVADEQNHCIRQLDLTNNAVTTLAGDVNGISGSNDGVGNAARFTRPTGIDTDDFGIIYVADKGNNLIRRIDPTTATVTTIAGEIGGGDQDSTDARKALFQSPNDLAVDNNGNIYVADRNNHKVRKITPAGNVTTLAGQPNQPFPSFGLVDSNTPSQVRFYYPSGIDVDDAGNVYVADQFNHRIRVIQPSGATTTFAGGLPSDGSSPIGPKSRQDVEGALNTARFFYPLDVHIAPSGRIYVADRGNHKIKAMEGGIVETYAGSYIDVDGSYFEGPAGNAEFAFPNGVVSDLSGQVYVIDRRNSMIRRTIVNNPAGVITGGGTYCAYSNPTVTLTLSDYNGAPDVSRIIRWERISQAGDTTTFPGNTATLNDTGFPLSPQTYTYRAIVNIGTCGQLPSETVSVEIAAPDLPVINSAPVCLTAPTVNVTLVASGALDGEYRWYDASGTTLLGTNDTLVVSIADTTDYLVSILKGTCETPRVSHKAIVIPLPTPTVNTVAPVCVGDVITYNTPIRSGATYSWAINGNGSFVGGSTSNSVQVRWHTVGGGTIQVSETINGCAGISALENLSIRPIPSPAIIGSGTACASDTTLYSVNNTGNNFNWTALGGTIVGSNTLDNVRVIWTAAGTGQLILRETIAATGCFYEDTLSVNINAKPAPVATGALSVCTGDTPAPYAVPNTGNTFLWSVNNGTIVGPNNQNTVTVTWGAAGSGSLIIQETIPSSGCINSDTLNITINPEPNPVISGTATLCNSDTLVYRVTNTGNNYSWSVTNGFIQGSNTLDSVVVIWNGSAAGQVRVRETIAATACFDDDTLDVIINALPTPAITGNNNVCFGNTYTYRTNATGNTFNWTATNGLIVGNADRDSVTVTWNGVSSGQLRLRETVVATGCFAENTFNITINPLPAPVIAGQDSVCIQDIENYTVAPSSNTFNWIVTGGTLTSGGNTNNATIQWTSAGTGQVIIEETSTALGCIQRDTLNIVVNPFPTPVITGNDTLCQGQTSIYNVLPVAGHTYNWTVANGLIISGQGTAALTVQWNNSGVGQVLVRETITATGCFLDNALAIFIQPQPVPVITGNATVCLNATHTYSIINTGNTYNWSVSNGTIIGNNTLDNVTVQWTGPDPGQLVITETVAATGCLNRDTLQVTINPTPNPVISGNSTVCQSQTENYQVTNTGNAYLWTVTNGTIVGSNTADNIGIIWNTSGQIIIRETILATGCFREDTLNVIVNPIPQTLIAGSDTVCTGTIVGYRIPANTGRTYLWAADNGTIVGSSTSDTVTVNWTGTGVGQLRIQETITASGCIHADTLDITIINQPNTDITGPTTLCAGDTATYQASGAPAGFTYLYTWTVQGGSILSGQNTQQVQIAWNSTPSGVEYVLVDIQVQGSTCTASTPLPSGPGDMGFVVVNPLPNPVINSATGLGDVCQFSTHQYGTSNDPANTYSWTVSGGNIISGGGTAQITVEWLTQGQGMITLNQTITATGCTQDAAPINVNILTSPGVPTTEDRNLCADGTANLYATEPTASQFNWYDVATGGTPLATTGTGTPYTTNTLNIAGSPYTFYVSGLNAAGCEGPRAPIQVTVDPSVSLQINELLLINVETCNNDTSGVLEVEIVQGNSPYTYNVSKDGAPYSSGSLPFGSDTLRLTALGIGTYVIDVVDDGGCTGSGTFTIISAPKYISGQTITSDTLIAEGESITLRANALDAMTFEWRDSLNNVLGTDSLLTITPPVSATYSVLITNDKGCDTTLSVRVDVVPLKIFVPNVFSPNGDSRNDRLQVYGTGIKSIQLRIFDRLGQLLFESNQWIEGANFDDTIGWDGTYNNKLQQNGNYVWSLNGFFINDQPFKKTGSVILMR